jgi:D-alanyl-D-alanine carboxypeptidase (penicillin-binding protein 5/6)
MQNFQIRALFNQRRKFIIVSFIFVFFIFSIILLVHKNEKEMDESLIAGTKNVVLDETKQINENISKYHPDSSWLKDNPQTLDITAKSAIVIDENTGKILYSKNEHESLAPASITKIMTAIIAVENLEKNQLCTVSEFAANVEPNKIVIRAGEKLRTEDLLYGLMMISANDAAEVLAESIDGNRETFIKKMNDKVRLLGLKDTVFKNPNGLDENEHLSSSYDIAVMTRYAIKNYPEILGYMGEKEDYSVYATDYNESHWWSHISQLLYNYSGADGVKTGYTENANHTLIATAIRDDRRITIVYFGSTDSTGDAVKLLDFGFLVNPSV